MTTPVYARSWRFLPVAAVLTASAALSAGAQTATPPSAGESEVRQNAPAQGANPPAMTEDGRVAQRLIFEAPHLQSVKAPAEIHYTYVRENADKKLYGEVFSDAVRLRVKGSGASGEGRDATLVMFTGERQRDPIDFKARTANPVILMFLEQDLWYMRQRVGGRPEYFKAKVASALRDSVQVEKATVKVDGRDIAATKLTFKPFIGDPQGERLQAFQTKTYEFLLSEAVPGEVVELRTTVYDGQGTGGKPVVEERLAFARVTSGG
jgi:hypothetical protein